MNITAHMVKISQNIKLFRVIAKIFMVLILVFWCGLLLARKIDLTNSDIGRHLMNGQVIFLGDSKDSQKILNSNFYSYTHPDHPFVNHHWAAGALFFSIWKLFGFLGLSVFYIFFCLIGFLVVFFIAWKESSFLFAYLIAILAAPLVGLRYEIRPEVATYFFAPIIFWMLWYYRQGKISFLWLFTIFPIFLIWVNFNLYFIVGIYLIGLFCADCLLKYLNSLRKGSERERRYWHEKLMFISVGGILSLIASMLNPWGFRGVAYPFLINSQIEMQVFELASPFVLKYEESIPFGFESYFILLAMLVMLLVVAMLKPFRDKFSLVIFVWALTLVVLSIAQARNIALFGLFSIPLVAIMGKAGWQVIKKRLQHVRLKLPWLENERSQALLLTILIIFAFSQFIAFNSYHLFNQEKTLGLGLKTNNLGILQCIDRNMVQGPIFNDFDISSYLIFGLFPQEKVFADHRPEAYPVDFLKDAMDGSVADREYWKQIDEKYRFNAIIVTNNPNYSKLNKFVNQRIQDPQWDLVCKDENAFVLTRKR